MAATPGTQGPGSCYFDQGDGNNAIQLPQTGTSTNTSTNYQAQVQQPINADGSSVFSAKSGTRSITARHDLLLTTVRLRYLAVPGTGALANRHVRLADARQRSVCCRQRVNCAADEPWVRQGTARPLQGRRRRAVTA
jgi:hypothetical protein